jgi:outer membrane protein assembly factor BamB
VAATADVVIVADRVQEDGADAFRCYRTDDGTALWTVRYPAPGTLDFGNSPRATPLITTDRAYLFGAHGHLHCVELSSGAIVWKKNVRTEFGAPDELPWGLCGSPLLVDGVLIVQPGGPQATVVALDAATGAVRWQTPGDGPGYGSLLIAQFGPQRQLIGHDATALNGWHPTTGRRLWRIVPDQPKDFNVPTPLSYAGELIVTTENNGTRRYRARAEGPPELVARYAELAPDIHTPVIVGQRLFGIHNGLHCVDLAAGLKPIYVGETDEFNEYGCLIGAPERLLAFTANGTLMLLDATSPQLRIIERRALLPGEAGLYAHPALVHDRLLVRSSDSLCAFDLR